VRYEIIFLYYLEEIKPILSSERMLHKDYYRKGSVEKKISGREPQGAWRQDELIGGKPPVVTLTLTGSLKGIELDYAAMSTVS
jgi:hypothetical protein